MAAPISGRSRCSWVTRNWRPRRAISTSRPARSPPSRVRSTGWHGQSARNPRETQDKIRKKQPPAKPPPTVSRPALEVADIFRDHGAAWRCANAGHVSLDQLKVMTAIERCRTAALGGHVERCEKCAHPVTPYTPCRNRHCPKCQAAAAQEWLAEREAELL